MDKMKRRIGIMIMIYGLLSGLCGTSAAQDIDPQVAKARRFLLQAKDFFDKGKYPAALSATGQALLIIEATVGSEDPAVALVLNQQAQIYQEMGEYARAEPLYRRSLEIVEKAFEPEHSSVAIMLNNLAMLLQDRGKYEEAMPLLQRALNIKEKALGLGPHEVSTALSNLAMLYQRRGEYGQAMPLFQRALTIDLKLGLEDEDLATGFNNLAELYRVQGDYDQALPYYQHSLEILEKIGIAALPKLAAVLNNLALLYMAQHDHEQALQYIQRALEIDEKAFGGNAPAVASDLNQMAGIYTIKGDNEQAIKLMKRALVIDKKALGLAHYLVATDYNNIASVYLKLGNDRLALQLLRQALAIMEKAVGPQHPDIVGILYNLAGFYREKHDYQQAINFYQRAAKIRESNIAAILDTGSQQQKQAYLDIITRETFEIISLHAQDLPDNTEAASLAMTTILRRKGRNLDAFTGQLAVLRQRAAPEDRSLLEQLTSVRAKFARLFGSEQRKSPEIQQLNAEAERLEDLISRSSAEFRAIAQPVTLKDIASALPLDTALVEMFLCYPFNSKSAEKKRSAAHYVAYVLHQGNEIPQFADLGEADTVDANVWQLHEALQDPHRMDIQTIARALDERVMRPVRQLSESRHLFLSPDGALNLIPFAALVDENGKYLVENYSFTYLTSGRDLLRLQEQSENQNVPVVVANPLYDLPATQQNVQSTAQSSTKRYSSNFAQKNYLPLPGTAEEAKILNNLLPDAQVWIQEQATEYRLKQINSPHILHIATHGFYLPSQSRELQADTQLGREIIDTLSLHTPSPLREQSEDPLLDSGLILAGVKQGQSGSPDEDGVLTALETAGLNLWGTDLVVLSACETGLGGVRYGEGVYGLRRALVLAGSRTQVMSLWKVSDVGTSDLMTAYYTHLKAGEGRTEALRQVQLAMLHGELSSTQEGTDYQHPYYWATFISSGDWRSLSMQNGGTAKRGNSGRLIEILSIISILGTLLALSVWRRKANMKQTASE